MIWPAWLTASFWSFWSKSTCGRTAASERAAPACIHTRYRLPYPYPLCARPALCHGAALAAILRGEQAPACSPAMRPRRVHATLTYTVMRLPGHLSRGSFGCQPPHPLPGDAPRRRRTSAETLCPGRVPPFASCMERAWPRARRQVFRRFAQAGRVDTRRVNYPTHSPAGKVPMPGGAAPAGTRWAWPGPGGQTRGRPAASRPARPAAPCWAATGPRLRGRGRRAALSARNSQTAARGHAEPLAH